MSRFFTRLFAVSLTATAVLSFAVSSVSAASDQSSVATPARPGGDAQIAKTNLEVVESAGRFVPDPLIPQAIESFVDDSIVTSKVGRLLVTKSMELSATCDPSTSGVLYFLIVDDVPIRNSAVFSRTGIVGQISGVTTDVVNAGTHTVRVGEWCTQPNATPTGGSVTLVGITSVIVLP